MWDLNSLNRFWTCTSCIGRWSLNHWTQGSPPFFHYWKLTTVVRKKWSNIAIFMVFLLQDLHFSAQNSTLHPVGTKWKQSAHKICIPVSSTCFLSSALILLTGSGFFMHFNSSSVNEGATAILESRILYPKRGFQCLQFFLYNSGSEDDQLNIYIREYSVSHVSSTLTLVEQIKGMVSFLFKVRQFFIFIYFLFF